MSDDVQSTFSYRRVSDRLPLDDPWSVLRLLCPDLGVCVVALVTVALCNRLVRNRQMVAAANITSVSVCVCVFVRIIAAKGVAVLTLFD